MTKLDKGIGKLIKVRGSYHRESWPNNRRNTSIKEQYIIGPFTPENVKKQLVDPISNRYIHWPLGAVYEHDGNRIRIKVDYITFYFELIV